jgi:uncharacterized membrane protein
MYFADRQLGHRRRAIARDKTVSAFLDLGTELRKAGRDAANRAEGLASGLMQGWRNDTPDEARLVPRIRACIGHVVSHPHAISVYVNPAGQVVLSGPVLAREAKDLLRSVSSVPGVREVLNQLGVYRDAEGVPELQGGRGPRPQSLLDRERWPPAWRVGLGTLGGAAVLAGVRQNGPAGWATAMAGAALLTRAALNKGFANALGLAGNADAVHIDKTIHIAAPVEAVYCFWANVENFPRFMSHLREVRDLGNGKSRWVADGPAGVPVTWEAETTTQIANVKLAWKSVPGSVIRTAGEVRFEPEATDLTRVEIRMSYTPPAGVVGHAIATLLGANPKNEIDRDLVRLKSLLETGRTRAHGHRVMLEGVAG